MYFAKAHSDGVSPAKMAREMPRCHTAGLNREFNGVWGGADDVESTRRRSSVRRQSLDIAASRTG